MHALSTSSRRCKDVTCYQLVFFFSQIDVVSLLLAIHEYSLTEVGRYMKTGRKKKVEEDKEHDDEDEQRDMGALLPAYIRMWAVATFVRVTTSAGAELRYKTPVAVAVLPALCVPKMPVPVLIAVCVRIHALLATTPYLHDSQWWSLYTDLAVLIAVLTALGRRRRGGTPSTGESGVSIDVLVHSFTRKEAQDIVAHMSAVVRIQLLLFYTSAALYKFNAGFMHPRFSCAPLFLVQLIDAYVPHSMQFPELINAVTAAAPVLILLIEAIIPVLMYFESRMGAACAALFHWVRIITNVMSGRACDLMCSSERCCCCVFVSSIVRSAHQYVCECMCRNLTGYCHNTTAEHGGEFRSSDFAACPASHSGSSSGNKSAHVVILGKIWIVARRRGDFRGRADHGIAAIDVGSTSRCERSLMRCICRDCVHCRGNVLLCETRFICPSTTHWCCRASVMWLVRSLRLCRRSAWSLRHGNGKQYAAISQDSSSLSLSFRRMSLFINVRV